MPLRFRAGDLVRVRGARWKVVGLALYEQASVIEVRGCDRSNAGDRARFVLPFERIDRLASATSVRVISPRRWRRAARAALADATPEEWALRGAMRARLAILPFQLEPALAVTRGLGTRVLIADEVGLGKTIQAGLVIAEVLARCPRDPHVLIVCPAALRDQWQAELRDRFGIDSTILDSAAMARDAGTAKAAGPWGAHPLAITSIDYVKRPEVMRALESLVWDVVVFDEAHALAGRSDRGVAAAALADRARTVVMLTGTPHSGDEEGFARMCGIGSLGGRFPLLAFRRRRSDVGLTTGRQTTWLRVRPTAAEIRMHGALTAYTQRVWSEKAATSAGARLAMTVLTKRACSGATSLARSLERRLMLLAFDEPSAMQMMLPLGPLGPDDEPFAELAAPGLDDSRVERETLEHLLALAREAAPHESKVRGLLRLLRRARQPAIVFTEYRDTLDRLAADLRGLAPVQLHGALSAAERRDAVQRFTSGAAPFLIATDAASEGLNLHQRCRLVVNLEVPWTPTRLEQRIGRVERIGQARRVHAMHLVARGTTEELTVARMVRRAATARRALDSMRPVDVREAAIMRASMEGADDAPDAPDRPATGPAIAAPDLSAPARLEAARLMAARRLAGEADGPAIGRPCATVLRRRRHRAECYWVFRIEHCDAVGRPVWQTVAGFGLSRTGLPRRAGPAAGAWLEALRAPFASMLGDLQNARTSRLLASMDSALTLAIEREESILETLRRRHARIAATLAQPGLFDTRAARAAAAQAAVREEAAERCNGRLADLAARRHLSGESTPAFAVILA